jgi:signal peptide peptidase SppA
VTTETTNPEPEQGLMLAQVPHIEQYAGVWAMEEQQFMRLAEYARGMDVAQHIQAATAIRAQKQEEPLYELTEGGVGVIRLNGAMTKYGSSLSGSQGTITTRRAVRSAARDESVKAIALLIDSPGGATAGTGDLADEVAAAAKVKPVVAYIEDLGASAAYWVASQASEVVANDTALVGSIGTYMVIDDWSGAYAQKGIKTHVIHAGQYKGAGVQGSDLTAEQIADFQRLVNEINDRFVRGVAKGRKMSLEQARELSDGRMHIAGQAQKLGLVDRISSWAEVVSGLEGTNSRRRHVAASNGGQTMSETNEPQAPKAATLQELKIACDGASPEFLLKQLEAGATVEQAMKAYMAELRQAKEAAEAQAQKAVEQAKAQASMPGVDPVSAGSAPAKETGDPVSQFNAAVADHIKTGLTKAQAIRKVAIEQSDLHAAYVTAYSTSHGGRPYPTE